MFYDRYMDLCQKRGMSPSKAAAEIGLNKASVTNWKKNGYTPRADVLQRIADYFGVSADYLIGGSEKQDAPAPDGGDQRQVSDNEIKFALFGDAEIDDEVLDEVKRFAQFAREQRRQKEQHTSD